MNNQVGFWRIFWILVGVCKIRLLGFGFPLIERYKGLDAVEKTMKPVFEVNNEQSCRVCKVTWRPYMGNFNQG